MLTKVHSPYSDKVSFIAINPDLKEIAKTFRRAELVRFIVTESDDIVLGNADYFYHCELINYIKAEKYKCFWMTKQINDAYILDCLDHRKCGYKHALTWFSPKNQSILLYLISIMSA